jgi:phospholipid/cholesterol/gamma-HCH transport system substrate-binding protein
VTQDKELLVGVVIVVAAVVGIGGTLWLQGANFGRPNASVEVLIESVGQLGEGNPVTYRGVNIGQVESVEVESGGDAVRVSLLIDESIPLPADAGVVVGPESLFGGWQAEIVSQSRYERFPFYEVPGSLNGTTRVIGGYALPEITRLTASAEQISGNLADLTDRMELAFNQETADNLASAISNIEAITFDVRELVQQQGAVFTSLSANADSALTEVESAAQSARRSFGHIEDRLADAQIDSMMANLRVASAGLRDLTTQLADEDHGLTATLERADSAFVGMDRIVAMLENGEGSLGRLMTDSTLAIRAEQLLLSLDVIIKDFQENPRRYVRLSIF